MILVEVYLIEVESDKIDWMKLRETENLQEEDTLKEAYAQQ